MYIFGIRDTQNTQNYYIWKNRHDEYTNFKSWFFILTFNDIYLHWCQYIIPTSLFYYINGHCFKFATSHKKFRQTCPPSILMLIHKDQSLKVWWKKNHDWQCYSRFVESDYSYTSHSWLMSCQEATSIATNYIKFSSFYGLSRGTTLKKKGVVVF